MTFYTIGHSNRTIDQFLALLRENDIELLADVRRFPSSKRLPQFNQDALSAALAEAGIEYGWFEGLGGRRSGFSEARSPNLGLRAKGFRQYADYMQTEPFQQAVGQLVEWASTRRTAIMCAEAVYWRCHRRLISDYLLAQGHAVQHILGKHQLRPHALTDHAQLQGEGVIYPPLQSG
jgi:uncharacterized protein (DUF488 family)